MLWVWKAAGGKLGQRAPVRQVLDPRDVDRVVPVVHARGLEVVDDVAEGGVGDHAGEALRADPARAHVLVTVRSRPDVRAGVVEVDHVQPPEAHQLVEGLQGPVHPDGRVQRVARAPEVGRVQAEPVPLARDAGRRHGLVDGAELLHRRAQPEAAPGTVLEHQQDLRCGIAHGIDDGAEPPREAIDRGRRTLAPVRPDVDVDEPRPVQLGHAQLVGQDVHRAPVRLGVRAGEVDEVGGVDRERRDAVARRAVPGTPAAQPADADAGATRWGCR